MQAAGADFGAAANWIPSGIRPFNFRIRAHRKKFLTVAWTNTVQAK